MRMTWMEPALNAIALVTSSGGTMLGIIARRAGWSNAIVKPRRNTKTYTCHSSIHPPMTSVAKRTLSPNTVTLVVSSTVRRLKLSATTPANTPKTTAGSVLTAMTRPRCTGDPSDRCSTSSGLATMSSHSAPA